LWQTSCGIASGKFELGNPYFATKGAIPPVCSLFDC
jgi:hypothetical protein